MQQLPFCPSTWHLPSACPQLFLGTQCSSLLSIASYWQRALSFHTFSISPQSSCEWRNVKAVSPGAAHRIHSLLLCLEFKLNAHPVYAVKMVFLQSFHQFRWPFLCCSRTRLCSFTQLCYINLLLLTFLSL